MTLVELVVVLAIIMAVAASSLALADRVSEQAWIEATDRNLEAAVAAVDGGGRADGAVGGFLADLGRWPQAPALSVPVGLEPDEAALAGRWQELVRGVRASDGTALPVWAMRSPSGDAEIAIACGWRGPYLGPGQVRDGWDGALRIEDAGGPLAWDAAGEIRGARSLGQDRAVDAAAETTTAMDRVRRCRTGSGVALALTARCLDTGGAPAASGFLILRVYAVRDGSVACVWQSPVWDLATPGLPHPLHATTGLLDPLVGSVAIRAYHSTAAPPASGADPVAADAASQIVYRTIAPWTTPAAVDLAVAVP